MKSARQVAIELGMGYRTLNLWIIRGVVVPTEIKSDMRGNLSFFSEEDIKKVAAYLEK